jgi:di/tripeptidase
MSRWLVGMSGDKDAMIRHLEKCEKRMLEQFAQIKEIANTTVNSSNIGPMKYEQSLLEIMELCNVYLDKRSDKQKMQDQIDEMQKKIEKMAGDSECGCC